MTSEISNDQFDAIVIGAGINGAGIARDAAMRGLKVLLLDKGDIGGGTSSWSTRLIHGGLRYLEHGELGLVRESLRERTCLMNLAPHLVRPLQILVPIYKHARRGLWTIRAGMIAYDALSVGKTLPRHRMLSAAETLQRAPGLNRQGLFGAALYFDAQVEFAERLVLENALSAVAHGATVVTYARVDKFIIQDRTVVGVEFSRVQSPKSNVQRPESKVQDEMSRGEEGGFVPALTPTAQDSSPTPGSPRGQPAWGGAVREGVATARIVINASGPWIDQVLGASAPDSPRLIGGTKGSHLIVAPFAGAPDNAIYVEAETDRRPFFIIPWNRNYLIGTTDIRYAGDLDHVRITGEETDYLLRETNRVIPKAHLSHRDILYSYSGVRPLPFTGDKDEQSITRKHFVRVSPHLDNLFSIVGGKLTTYRSLAAQTVDLVLQQLGRRSPPGTTDREPLPGAATRDFEDFRRDFKQRSGLPDATSDRLLRIYGTRSYAVTNLIAQDPSLGEVFDPETRAIAAEVVFAFRHELAQTLSDCLLRRTMVGLNSTCGLDAVDGAAKIAQKHLAWSEDRTAQEIAQYRKEVSRRFCGKWGSE